MGGKHLPAGRTWRPPDYSTKWKKDLTTLPLPHGPVFPSPLFRCNILTSNVFNSVTCGKSMSLLAGKIGIVFGVANKRSIAWAIAQAWHKAGARLAFTYQGERLKENVEELASTFGSDTLILPCDVAKDDHIARVFDEAGKRFGRLHLM